MLSEKVSILLEHLFAGFIRNHLNSDKVEIIDVSPMGCRTGFYMSLIGTPDEKQLQMLGKSYERCSKVKKQNDIPELNIFPMWNMCYAFT